MMEFLERGGGVRIAYRVHNAAGTKTPMLLSHGFSATSTMWDRNVGELSAERPVVVWDHRGHGHSDSPADPRAYSERISTDDMIALLDKIGAQRAIIAGMSLGGYLSLAFQLRHPLRVAALVLVDTGPGFKNDAARAQWNEVVESYARRVESEGFHGALSPELADAVHHNPGGLAPTARRVMAQHDDQVIRSLDKIMVPTLVVVGENDRNYLPGADYMTRHIKDARKVVLAQAGHASNIDQAAAFNTTVLDFLENL
jgi:pimeloyl-ACP methyl ester carboxylesterase